jgi:hypothetical protein
MAERVGFVPDDLAPINDLRAIGTARNRQIHSKPEYEVQNRHAASISDHSLPSNPEDLAPTRLVLRVN